MTTKLYWHDSRLTQFSARVVDCFVQDSHPVVVLDQSAFYPGGGGQPHDTGTLNEARVLAVSLADDGRMLHHLDGVIPVQVGAVVAGAVDWSRRLEVVQQDTGGDAATAHRATYPLPGILATLWRRDQRVPHLRPGGRD